MRAPPHLRPARARVPASTSNLGAGFDCVGLALDRYLTAAYRPGAAPLEVERTGTLAALDLPPERDALARAFRDALAAAGLPGDPGGVLRVDSAIPVGRGLGSSAAATVAGLALGAVAAGRRVDRDALLAEAVAREGHPDNAAPALLGGLVAVARDPAGAPRPIPLSVAPSLGFAYAAPHAELSTAAARAALPAVLSHAVAARGLGRLAALLEGLRSGEPDLLRLGFADELHVPYRLALIPGAGAALAAAERAGAWAATISGAGSGLIAVAPPPRAGEVAAAMAAAFEAETGPGAVHFAARPDPDGARIEQVAP